MEWWRYVLLTLFGVAIAVFLYAVGRTWILSVVIEQTQARARTEHHEAQQCLATCDQVNAEVWLWSERYGCLCLSAVEPIAEGGDR